MGNRDYLDVRRYSINNGIRVACWEDVAPTVIRSDWPTVWGIGHFCNSLLQRQEKAAGGKRTSFRIPIPPFLCIHDGLGMPAEFTRNHGKAVP